MNISCEIIKDLLPLYKDDVCSIESQKLIEEHLQSCAECKKLWEQMSIDINVEKKELNFEEAKSIERLSKKWNRKLMLSMIKGILLTLLILAIIAFVLNLFISIKIA